MPLDRRQFGVWVCGVTAASQRSAQGGIQGGMQGAPVPRNLTLRPKDTVRIDIDANGVPHIQAQSVEDAFFGQGYAAAWMRMWQLDINHRRLVGRLAAAFGPSFVDFDHAARLVLSQTPPQDDWKALGERLHGIARAWVAGINCRVAEVRQDKTLRAPEFELFDLDPDFWEVDDLVRIRYCGSPNVKSEFRRALLAQQGLLHLDALAQKLEPAHELQRPPGLLVEAFKPGQLALFEKLSDPLPWTQAWHPAQRVALRSVSEPDNTEEGSNAWVISGRHTRSGRPIIANDPHLAFSIPGPRMVTHLMAPGFNVTGAGPVWRPGVQFGHNEHIAFGRTDFQIDQEDLYVLELDASGTSYRGPEGAVPLVQREERIEARGASPVQVTLRWAAMGPVFHHDVKARTALAVRAVWLQPATCVALEYVPKLFAHDWPTFRRALRAAVWGTNYMYVDAQGHIGWQAAGRVPVRARHDGLMPVPASGGYEWTGILSLDDMPHEFDPERGWIGTANQCPTSPNWPRNGKVISFEWKPDDRYRRVEQLLRQQVTEGATVEMSWRDQQDVLSLRALELTSLLRQVLQSMEPGKDAGKASVLKSAEELTAQGQQLAQSLLLWDGRLDARSTTATGYAAWWSQLQKEARQALVPQSARALITTLHPHAVTSWLGQLANSSDGLTVWVRSLNQAAAALMTLSSAGSAGHQWPAWGELHRVDLRHVLGTWLPVQWKDRAHALGGMSGGDSGAVQARWYASFDRPRVTGGASFRAVLEAGAWESARAINFPGQSGDPRSPHYKDLYERWVSGASMALPFTAQEVQRASQQTLTIRGQNTGT